MESDIRFNILVNSLSLEYLQNQPREKALERGCEDNEADDFAQKWGALVQRALVILDENPQKVWAADFRQLTGQLTQP